MQVEVNMKVLGRSLLRIDRWPKDVFAQNVEYKASCPPHMKAGQPPVVGFFIQLSVCRTHCAASKAETSTNGFVSGAWLAVAAGSPHKLLASHIAAQTRLHPEPQNCAPAALLLVGHLSPWPPGASSHGQAVTGDQAHAYGGRNKGKIDFRCTGKVASQDVDIDGTASFEFSLTTGAVLKHEESYDYSRCGATSQGTVDDKPNAHEDLTAGGSQNVSGSARSLYGEAGCLGGRAGALGVLGMHWWCWACLRCAGFAGHACGSVVHPTDLCTAAAPTGPARQAGQGRLVQVGELSWPTSWLLLTPPAEVVSWRRTSRQTPQTP